MTDIEKIITQCRKGVRHAQKELYEQFAPQMFAVCIQYSKNKMEAEDLLHEGFLKIFEKIDQYRGEGALGAWMRRIMVNTILEEFRNKSKIHYIDNPEFKQDYIIDDDYESENDNLIYDVDIEYIKQLIEQLPDKYKIVFNLYVIENYTHEKIASELGISIGTSKSNLSRARKWLKNKVNEQIVEKLEA